MAKKGKGWKVGIALGILLLIAFSAAVSDWGNAIVAYWNNNPREGDLWLLIGGFTFLSAGIIHNRRRETHVR